ncbi:MAG: FkbM family methyltransferase [Elusimicrobiota bacterium]
MNDLLRGTVLNIADIGASGGLHPRWGDLTSCLHAILVEPDSRASLPHADGDDSHILRVALTRASGNVRLFQCRKQQVSSLHEPHSPFLRLFHAPERYEIVNTIDLTGDNLDRQLNLIGREDLDFMKLDVQGHESAVLEGASRTLTNIIGVESEARLAPIYGGGCSFGEIHERLTSHGLQLIDLRRHYWTRADLPANLRSAGQLTEVDALYFLPPEVVLKRFASNPLKILRAFACYLAYRYWDFAFLLTRQAESEQRLPATKTEHMRRILRASGSLPPAGLPRSERLSRLFRRCAAFISPLDPGYHHDPDWDALDNL